MASTTDRNVKNTLVRWYKKLRWYTGTTGTGHTELKPAYVTAPCANALKMGKILPCGSGRSVSLVAIRGLRYSFISMQAPMGDAVAEQAYIPIQLRAALRGQAVRVWLVGCGVVLIWALLIIVAPIAKANGLTGVSTPLYTFYGYICHQIPNRSFHIEGEQFGVCSRCFGVYFGLLFGYAIYPLWRRVDEVEPISRIWLFLSLIPIGVDWSLGVFGIWENTFTSRFITGTILGVACATFIVPATVEITRNFTIRSRIKKAA